MYSNYFYTLYWLLSLKTPVTPFLGWISKVVLSSSAGTGDEWNQALEVKTNLIIHVNKMHNKNIPLNPHIYIAQDTEAVSEG